MRESIHNSNEVNLHPHHEQSMHISYRDHLDDVIPTKVNPKYDNFVVKLYDLLHTRNVFFGDKIFGDPAWSILLKLFIAQGAGEPVRTAEICAAADIPPSAASRWIKILVQNGHVTQQGLAEDSVFTLTARASETLAALLGEVDGRRE